MTKSIFYLFVTLALLSCKKESKPDLLVSNFSTIETSNRVETKKEIRGMLPVKYVVIAKSGLSIRNKPSLKGNRIGKLPYMSQTNIEEKTNETLELKDDGKLIKGHWVKIKIPESIGYGYVFDGFLQEKNEYIEANKEILIPSSYSDFGGKESLDKLSPYWAELYEGQDAFYIDNAKYTMKRGYNECTGDSLTFIMNKRKTLLFINDLSLVNGYNTNAIPFINSPKETLWQKDEFSFSLSDKEYTMKVSGTFTEDDAAVGFQGEKDYILTLFSAGNSQVIFNQNKFNDTVVKILFIGDIDGDGKPDFVIDCPRHYEESRKILLMSSDADAGDFIKKRAEFSLNFGC